MSAGAFRAAGLHARNIPLDTQSTWAVLVGTLPKSALQLAKISLHSCTLSAYATMQGGLAP